MTALPVKPKQIVCFLIDHVSPPGVPFGFSRRPNGLRETGPQAELGDRKTIKNIIITY